MPDHETLVSPTQADAADPEEPLSLGEAATRLGISQRTLQRLLERGEVRATKVGRQWRFRQSDLAVYLGREPAAVPSPPMADLDQMESAADGLLEGEELRLSVQPPGDASSGAGGAFFPDAVPRLAGAVLQAAVRALASDVHVEPGGQTARVRFRLDGVLHEVARLPPGAHDALVSWYKEQARANVAERRLPQVGRFGLRLGDLELEARLSALPVLRGEKVVMRLLDRRNVLVGLERLGFYPEMLEQVLGLVSHPRGLLVVTGPTGAGKSTTLYSLLIRLASDAVNVLTVEDPVEFELPGVAQTAVDRRLGLTFAAALRALLRQDPDILMVAQLPDLETVELAVQAAFTGHLVLAAMNPEDTAAALVRLIEMGLAPFLANATVSGILAQRLVRRLCPACRAQGELPTEMARAAERIASQAALPLPANQQYWRPVGCLECRQTGYRGRIGLFELLQPGPQVRAAVLRRASWEEVRASAIAEGMRPLAADGLRKALDGITSIEEVLRVAALF